MEEWERKVLMNELIQGRELAQQLQIHINSQSSSPERAEPLVNSILASYEKSLSVLNTSSAMTGEPPPAGGPAPGSSESPPSLGGSPVSERDGRDGSRKRKSTPRWTRQVKVAPGAGLEGPLDDGYGWRKYGQKDILGAKHPRGYYRCTHQKLQGCLATKQVQRSDTDPTVFEITYCGSHTCNQHQSSDITAPGSSKSPEDPDPEPTPNPPDAQTNQLPPPPEEQQQEPEIFLEFCRGLRVITEGFDSQSHPFTSLNFSSPSITGTEPSGYPHPLQENRNVMGNFLTPYLPPAASEAMNPFSDPALGINSYSQDFHGSELARVVSGVSSTMSPPTVNFDFPIDKAEFDPDRKFNRSGSFS